jgi:hypothetical protein
MPKEEDTEKLLSMMSAVTPPADEPDDNGDDQKPDDKSPVAGELELPKYTKQFKAPKKTAEESAAELRRQRDEARQALAEKEEQLAKANQAGTIFDEVKKLIKKDEVTPDDLKQIFDDYDFTKREKEALEKNLKETQAKLRDYDINSSPEFIESYVKPIEMAVESLKAEILPIIGNEPMPVPNGAENELEKLVASGNINPTSVKVALMKIKQAYVDADIDYEMPSVKNVTSYLLDIAKGVADKNKAYEEWETLKEEKKREQEESQKQRQGITQVKSRQERRKIAQEFLNRFVQNEDFDYLAEMHGAEDVMSAIADQHSFLTDVMDDPSKAPTYDGLLEAFAKAKLFDRMIEEKKGEMKLAIAKKERVKLESVARPAGSSSESSDPVLSKLKEMGVGV